MGKNIVHSSRRLTQDGLKRSGFVVKAFRNRNTDFYCVKIRSRDEQDGPWYTGSSMCHPNDRFERAEGFHRAAERALVYWISAHGKSKEYRSQVWDIVWERHGYGVS